MSLIEKHIARFGGEERTILILVGVCFILVVFLFFMRVGELLASAIRMGKRKKAERKNKKFEQARAMRFTLPDKRNSYVRERLRTALQTEAVEEEEPMEVRLGYVKKMLAKVKEASLSPVERLDVEEITGLIALYTAKEKWSTEDRKAVNEVFARLLKLSAKYEIAV